MWIRRLALPAACCVFFLGTPAAAATPPQQACTGKSKGDTCSFTRPVKEPDKPMGEETVAGACVQDECCELDYSKGSPPQSVCGPCLVCKEGAAAAVPVPSPDNPREAKGGNADSGKTDPPASAGNGAGGCTVGGAPGFIPLLLLGLFLPRSAVLRARR